MIPFEARPIDALDIVLLAFLVYQLLLLIRGTRAVQMITGIAVVGLAYYASQGLGLRALASALGSAIDYIPLAVIVLFQSELREALASFGRTGLIETLARKKPPSAIDDLSEAAWALARKKLGAILVLEREQGLKNYIQTGVRVDAPVSSDLLLAIFCHESPLHDGACIVRDGRIVAASCFLPLTQKRGLDRTLGSRHRAALGMTEETDAVAVVVSEETGLISLSAHGQLFRGLSRDDVASKLRESMSGGALA